MNTLHPDLFPETLLVDVADGHTFTTSLKKEREANALYAIRPRWRAIVQNPGLPRTQLIGLTGHKSTGSITACRRRMRQIGLLESLTDKKEAA